MKLRLKDLQRTQSLGTQLHNWRQDLLPVRVLPYAVSRMPLLPGNTPSCAVFSA